MIDALTKNGRFIFIPVFVLLLVISFIGGWIMRGRPSPEPIFSDDQPVHNSSENGVKVQLRLGGDTWTRPLLVCDTNPLIESSEVQQIKNLIDNEVQKGVQKQDIQTASVYFRNLITSEQFAVRGNEKFYPSSLRKVPLLISVLKMAETSQDILNNVRVALTGEDQNGQQEIKPKEFAEVGKTYLVKDLLEKMIRYSDNNATAALASVSGVDTIRGVFENMYVPFVGSPLTLRSENEIEGLTAYQFSFFLRVLYNATYLDHESSSRALRLMSEVDFKEGLVSGVPGNIPVAHKFGLMTLQQKNGPVVNRQLHDCGIVYHIKSPYVLCVMTKSTAPILQIEQFIGRLSAIVYTGVSNMNKSG